MYGKSLSNKLGGLFLGGAVKKYEYKFVRLPVKIGWDYEQKIREMEEEWNRLGEEGWKFCKEGNGVVIFIREVVDE